MYCQIAREYDRPSTIIQMDTHTHIMIHPVHDVSYAKGMIIIYYSFTILQYPI